MGKRLLKRGIKILVVLLILVTGLAIALFDTIDREPLDNKAYYKEFYNQLGTLSIDTTTGSYFKAGWSKSSIIPEEPLSIASYGRSEPFDRIHDSIWARAFVFENGSRKAALVTIDLLIFPPAVVEKLKSALPKGYSLKNTYLSATHTHNGPGGWAENIGGRFMAGKFSEQYVELIAKAIVSAIKEAESSMEEVSIGYQKWEACEYVTNRLVGNEGELDYWLKAIKLKSASGKTALLTSFSAHATCLSSKVNEVSGDYPGELVRMLEKDERVDFAAFCAGPVGSHAPTEFKEKNFKYIDKFSSGLSSIILEDLDSIATSVTPKLFYLYYPIQLNEPHFKIDSTFRFRPWVFETLFGDYDPAITALKIGDQLLIGTPCDFSGELSIDIEPYAEDKNLNLMITSFNGGYIGYITEDCHYNLHRSETHEMNWFGPYNGRYFKEMIIGIISKL